MHLSPWSQLLAKKIDSDLKAKKGFIRSVCDGSSSQDGGQVTEPCGGQRRHEAGLKVARTFLSGAQALLLMCVGLDCDFGPCVGPAQSPTS